VIERTLVAALMIQRSFGLFDGDSTHCVELPVLSPNVKVDGGLSLVFKGADVGAVKMEGS
jgi:hypothetical protein